MTSELFARHRSSTTFSRKIYRLFEQNTSELEDKHKLKKTRKKSKDRQSPYTPPIQIAKEGKTEEAQQFQ
jgi:hypothetical protein